MSRLTFVIAVAWLVVVAASPVRSVADPLTMPNELVDFARAHGCEPLTDFYDSRPGMVEPPYVYGVLDGEKEDSAAFWCRKSNRGKDMYQLIFKVREASALKGCPSAIEREDPPGGLSVQVRPDVDLRAFYYVDQPKQAGPNTRVPNARVVVSYYDGLSEAYVCYQGRWLILSMD